MTAVKALPKRPKKRKTIFDYAGSLPNLGMPADDMRDDSTTIETLKRMALAFRDERDWKKFHKPKDLAMGMSIETGELLELFLWKSEEEIARMLQSPEQIEKLRHEIADVFIYLMYLGHECNIDISKAVSDKIEHNAKKYPAHKSKGKSAKYTEL